MLTKHWMQEEVIQIKGDTSIGEAKEIIDRHNFRHIPVTDGSKLLGIITQNDINKTLPSLVDSSISAEDHIIATQTKVSSVMSTHPLTVPPHAPLAEAVSLLKKHKIGAIPVVKDGNLVGIITETDIFDAFAAIMDGEENDICIELQINNTQGAIYKITDICKDANIWITSLTLYRNYSPEHQLVTLRVNGTEIDNVIDALWDSGMKIIKITGMEEEQ